MANIKVILNEINTNFTLYYKSVSSNIFNFMFILDLNSKSSAIDFKRLIVG